MGQTKMRCGLAVAAYVDDGQGRRIVVASEDRRMLRPVPLATTKAEARAAIAVLRQLAEELPGDDPIVTPPPIEVRP